MKIGISISGGGYRATSFGLGTLSYLNHLKDDNDINLLKSVIALSTVSGGSITGITYAQWSKAGLKFEDYFNWLYSQITEFDLIKHSISNYVENKEKNSLIEGFSSSYGNHLLTHKKFCSIIPEITKDAECDTHLLYYTINATDFNTGSPFRFIAQHPNWSEYLKKNNLYIKNKENENVQKMNPFIIGNGFFKLSKNTDFLPLNVALAASSCFPGGFEPIILKLKKHVVKENELHDSVSLMDGGIVDNQGIDSLINFHEKINLDLAIVVDSASPKISKYKQSEEIKIPIIGNWNLLTLTKFTFLINFIVLILLISSLYTYNIVTIICSLLFFLFTSLSFLLYKGKKIITKLLKDEGINIETLEPLNNLTPNTITQLAKNRFLSLKLLIGSVFMKHLRRLNTETIFKNYKLNNKIIVNTLYQYKNLDNEETFLGLKQSSLPLKEKYEEEIFKENEEVFKKLLSKNGIKTKKYNELMAEKLKVITNPILEKIADINAKAHKMDTTLWVSKDEEGKQLIKDVIVTAQINTCTNIINNKHIKKQYPKIHAQAVNDWKRFIGKESEGNGPYWLFNEITKNSNKEEILELFKKEKEKQEKKYSDLKLDI